MKTSNYLKVSLGFLVTVNIILAISELVSKNKLKNCETRQSFRCPRFTCPYEDTSKPGCGTRPWFCSDKSKTCSGNHQCVGYCKSGEKNCFD